MQHALPVRRAENFASWYQAVVDQADLAEDSGVRGCMIIRPWGYAIWQRMQELLDRRFRETGHENCYFPLFIPLSFIAKEAEHVEGFAKEMAMVTHHRLKIIDGTLQPDPDAKVYRSFAEDSLAMPVIAGEKPVHERFPGADNTFSIEAMMQDGKALQAGTAHYLGTNFARAQNIRYQTELGDLAFVHTTSWGVSTRLVGGVVMTHGDDDGLRLPPVVAPRQVVLVPILRDRPEDSSVVDYCESLAAELRQAVALGEPIRAAVDRKPGRAIDKRWAWIKRGVPIVCEIGARDVAASAVTLIRRDRARKADRIDSESVKRAEFVQTVPALLAEIQAALHGEARKQLLSNINSDLTTLDELIAYFKDSAESEAFRGWARVAWARPQGAALSAIEAQLKAQKLTIRNAPLKQDAVEGKLCIFSGAQAQEFVLVGRAY